MYPSGTEWCWISPFTPLRFSFFISRGGIKISSLFISQSYRINVYESATISIMTPLTAPPHVYLTHINVWSVAIKGVHIQAETAVESRGEQNRMLGVLKDERLFLGLRKFPKKGLGLFKARKEDCADGFLRGAFLLSPSIKTQLSISASESAVSIPAIKTSWCGGKTVNPENEKQGWNPNSPPNLVCDLVHDTESLRVLFSSFVWQS